MAITFERGSEPIWTLINLDGTLAGGGYIVTKSSLTFADKAVYMDAGGTSPYPNPIIFLANGTQGPFFFRVDDAAPDDNYFLQAFDSDGRILWTMNNYVPDSGGGGGGTIITNNINLQNFINNNVFDEHVNATVASPLNLSAVTNQVIAPSNHKGFTPALINPVVGTFGVVGPDIRFVKNNTSATDSLSFVPFVLTDNALSPDVTPVEYLRFNCTVQGIGESYKCFQFPITQKVKNLAGQPMTFQCWARVNTTPVNIKAWCRQYFGNGTGATAEAPLVTRTQIGADIALTTTWTKININFTVPVITGGQTIGAVGSQTDDDALYLQIEMPLNDVCDVFFTKPALHLGTLTGDQDYDTFDQIQSISQTPRTGDARIGYSASAPNGWVACDTTIGNVGSGATRANKDTFQLYKTLWDAVSNTYAPVAAGRGATAIADFLANKAMTLPLVLGRALAGAGSGAGLTARALGEFLGTETIAIADMPSHTHNVLNAQLTQPGGGTQIQGGTDWVENGTLVTTSTGGSAANGKMQPTSFMNVFIKL